MAHSIQIFSTVFIILLFLGIFVPIINIGLNTTTEVNNPSDISDAISGNNLLSILLNVISILFWTFGLNIWINIILLLPIRIIGVAALYHVITPTKGA